VLRGVEDGLAYRAAQQHHYGARPRCAARRDRAEPRASPAACAEMLAILGRQHFKEGTPRACRRCDRVSQDGLGRAAVYHDAAIVQRADPKGRGRRRYVLVVLTGGISRTRSRTIWWPTYRGWCTPRERTDGAVEYRCPPRAARSGRHPRRRVGLKRLVSRYKFANTRSTTCRRLVLRFGDDATW